MSLLDTEISKAIWNGKIPIKVSLDRTEMDVYGTDKVWDPIHLEVPRCSYLPLVTKDIQQILIGLGMQIPNQDMFESVWYDYNATPLKWHYPIGLLYDLYASSKDLPWSLTLHFKDLPSNSILLKPTPETMQDMFMSMIKEADFLRNGSTKKVMNLSKRDSTQLWQSLASDKYDDFHSVNRQLVEYSDNLRNIPLKIYLPDDCLVIQELVSFYTESEKETIPTMGDVIHQIIPDIFLSEKKILDPKVALIIHGVNLPLDTPVNWAYENLSFADNFLHIVVTFKA